MIDRRCHPCSLVLCAASPMGQACCLRIDADCSLNTASLSCREGGESPPVQNMVLCMEQLRVKESNAPLYERSDGGSLIFRWMRDCHEAR